MPLEIMGNDVYDSTKSFIITNHIIVYYAAYIYEKINYGGTKQNLCKCQRLIL